MIGVVLAGAAAGLASVPHCAAMCGALAALGSQSPGVPSRRPALAFHGARLVAYTVLGLVAGTVGGGLRSLFADARVVHVLLAGSLAVGLGLAAARLWREARREPALVQLGVVAPKKRPALRRSVLLGASTACLPCGALLAGALVAASAGSALGGGLTMLAFAIASSPGLWAASWAAARLRGLSLTGRRVLSVALALGALVVTFRAVDAFRTETPSCCHVSHG
ncbi:MAG: hypothetical protein CMN30_10960 [Sandaracinus sp.]|nr:hypothetical protein [Sandaracinus sp.]